MKKQIESLRAFLDSAHSVYHAQNFLKRKLEDAEYRIKIAANPTMKEDAEIEYRNRLREIDSLEAEIESDEARING